MAVSQLSMVAGIVSLVLGRRRAAQLLAVVALVPTISSAVIDIGFHDAAFSLSHIYWLLITVLFVIALVAFHREAPPIRQLPWLLAILIGIIGNGAIAALAFTVNDPALIDTVALYFLGITFAAGSYLFLGRKRRNPSWTLTLSLLSLAILGLRVLTLIDFLRFAPAGYGNPSLVVAVRIGEAVILTIVALPLTRLSIRELRHLQPSAPRPTNTSS